VAIELEFSLHPKQAEIFNSPARFKVIPAGRQSGKTHLAVAKAVIATLATHSWGGVELDGSIETAYIYPTFEQGKKIVWPRLKAAVEPLDCKTYENTGMIEFPNGRRLRLLGADNPDSLRGFTWSDVILDEYKDMIESVFPEIIRPALSVVRGGGMFIGTPKGKNHFYHLYKTALAAMADGDPEWAAFTFTSAENPFITSDEIRSMSRDMSATLISQELEASFVSQTGKMFSADAFPLNPDEPLGGDWVISVDLAGFTRSHRSQDYARRDETAIAIVKVGTYGWWVKEIVHGRWDVRETALRIFMAARSVKAQRVGIEKGALMAAVGPYLTDLMRQNSNWLNIEPLSHGNKRKADRIQWALQGRAEKGRIELNPGPWNAKLLEQALDFPDGRSPDDLLDALAYTEQMARVSYIDDFESEEWQPLDAAAGY